MDDLIRVTKATLWEEAKGKLRAMIAVEGQVPSHAPEFQARRDRYKEAEIIINTFITKFEGYGLHE